MLGEVKIPSKLRRQAELKAKSRAASEADWAKSRIESYTNYINEQLKKLANAEKEANETADKWAEVIAKLKKARFKVETNNYGFDLSVEVSKKRLGDLHRTIGRLDPQSIMKDLVDGQKKLVKVSLRSVKYPMLTVSFLTKVSDKDKCKVEAVEVPARTEYRLVCSN